MRKSQSSTLAFKIESATRKSINNPAQVKQTNLLYKERKTSNKQLLTVQQRSENTYESKGSHGLRHKQLSSNSLSSLMKQQQSFNFRNNDNSLKPVLNSLSSKRISMNLERITNENVNKVSLGELISQVDFDRVAFEGMPRMIFEEEHRNEKINWIRLVNNMISFKKQTSDTLNRRSQQKNQRDMLTPLQRQKEIEKQKYENLNKRLSTFSTLKNESQTRRPYSIVLRTASSKYNFILSPSEMQQEPSFRGKQRFQANNQKSQIIKADQTCNNNVPFDEYFESPDWRNLQLTEYQRRQGTESMIEFQKEDPEYEFMELNMKGKVRRKSCICTQCCGTHFPSYKGLQIVLQTDYPYCKWFEQKISRAFGSQLAHSSTFNISNSRFLSKHKSTNYRKSSILASNQGGSTDAINNVLMIQKLVNLRANNPIIKVEESNQEINQDDEEEKQHRSGNSSFQSGQGISTPYSHRTSSRNSSKDNSRKQQALKSHFYQKKKLSMSPKVIIQKNMEYLKQKNAIKVPQPLFNEKYGKKRQEEHLDTDLLSQETKQRLKLPHLTKDMLRTKLQFKDSNKAYLAKLLHRKPSKERSENPYLKGTHSKQKSAFKVKPFCIPEKIALTSKQFSPQSSHMRQNKSQSIQIPGGDINNYFNTKRGGSIDQKPKKLGELKIDTMKSLNLFKGYSYTPLNSTPKIQSFRLQTVFSR